MLRVYLLGELNILWNDRPIPSFSNQIVNGLFGFLCLHPNQEFTREFLADVLWAERPVDSAWRSLNAAVEAIKDCFTQAGVPFEDYLRVTSESIELRAQNNFWLDVIEFECTYNSSDVLVLQSAVQVYRGPLLENINDAWCRQERLRLEQHYLQALKALITLTGKAAQYQQTASLAEIYLKLKPADEEIQSALLVALSGLGNVPGVVEHYEQYCIWLQREHQIEPGLDLQRLVQQLTSGWQPAVVNPPQVGQRAPVSTQITWPGVSTGENSTEQNIFVGRHAEMEQMAEWCQQRQEPVMCMTGQQGCGKTRLAQEFAYQMQMGGALVGWARCSLYHDGMSYPALSDILRSLLVQVPAGVRSKIPDGLVRDALVFFPELQFFFPTRPREVAVPSALPAPIKPGMELVYVSNTFTRMVLYLAEAYSILLVMDDFQHVSSATQLMLEHLLCTLDLKQLGSPQGVKILLMGIPDKTQPEQSSACLLVERLLQDGMVRHLELSNLNRDDIRQWLFLWSGNPHKVNALAEKLYLQTGGNPYYLKETIHTLTYTGSLLTGSQGWDGAVLQGHDPQLPVPPAVRSQLENRLRRLSMLGLQVIQAAAVIGPLVPLHLLVDMIRRDGDDLLDAISELMNAGLLAEFTDEDVEEEVFRFPCLLYKQTIYEQTTQVRKSVLEKRMVRIAQEGLNGRGLL